MKNFWQLYIAGLTAALFIVITPMVWLFGARSIIDQNSAKSTLQVVSQAYQSCISYYSSDNSTKCHDLKDQLTALERGK